MEVAVDFEEDDLDWERVLDSIPEVLADLFEEVRPVVSNSAAEASPEVFANPLPDSLSPWIGEIEHLLMNDDELSDDVVGETDHQFFNEFMADILLDSPTLPSANSVDEDKNSGASDDCGREKRNTRDSNASNDDDDNDDNGEDDDPISKKRRRQLRNRDAALRSRERKKLYLKDLEMKSRYLEGECRRLGRLLECCIAENHALRFYVQNDKAFVVPMAKQESAVLLLESLLLGSLLWFLGIICLFNLPNLTQATLEAVSLESGDSLGLETVAPRKARSKIIGYCGLQSFLKSKRCKASRTRMKSMALALGF